MELGVTPALLVICWVPVVYQEWAGGWDGFQPTRTYCDLGPWAPEASEREESPRPPGSGSPAASSSPPLHCPL